MNTEEIRAKFQASHQKLPTQVLDKYWGGIGYKDRTTQEQWKGYQQAVKDMEASEQELISSLRYELGESCNELEAYVNAEYPEFKREYLSNAMKYDSEIKIINMRRRLAEESSK